MPAPDRKQNAAGCPNHLERPAGGLMTLYHQIATPVGILVWQFCLKVWLDGGGALAWCSRYFFTSPFPEREEQQLTPRPSPSMTRKNESVRMTRGETPLIPMSLNLALTA